MQLKSILQSLDDIAPLKHAEAWDNVGLLAGDPQQSISRVFLTIDYTTPVAAEAAAHGCDLVIAYHPPIFSAVKRLTAEGSGALIHDAIRRGIAIYSPHTAWDAAPGGTNDVLGEILGLIDISPLRAAAPNATQFKLVTFVPQSHLESLSSALFAAGAGHIGKYSSCSFQSPGTGTFFGDAGTHPAVGQSGKLEKQPEVRLETVVAIEQVDAIVRALRKAHPYEEPAFDLTVLAAPPSGIGHGRLGSFPAPNSMDDLIDKLKNSLNLPALLIAGSQTNPIKRVAICAGAGGDLLDSAIHSGADVFVTGELRHHDALKAAGAGMSVICTLHSNSERVSLLKLKARLEESLPHCPPIVLSQVDRDPFLIR